MVIWIIGMSASGKTTLGKKLYERLQSGNERWVFLDGDTFRNILGEDLGHTVEDRRKNAYRISRFCEFLSAQKINVLACVLSIFHDNQKYNRENIEDYREVYIDVAFEKLVERDNKQLYKQALEGKIENVVGVDIDFKPPYAPDMTLDNNMDSPDFDAMVANIMGRFDIPVDEAYSYTKANLLEYPQKYQYSKYEGEAFFLKLQNDRNRTIDYLNKRLKKLNLLPENVMPDIDGECYTDNNELLLKPFLQYLYSKNGAGELARHKDQILLLIKRFEVSKKLYSRYSVMDIRKSSAESDNLGNYALFSLVLLNYFHVTESVEEQLMYFNAILKVNDILSSAKYEIYTSDEIVLSLAAIQKELELIHHFGEACL